MKNEVMGPEFRMLETMSKYCDGVVPPVFSWVFPGMCFMTINSCEFLESIYIQQNQFHSKHESIRITYSTFIGSNVAFQATKMQTTHRSDKRSLELFLKISLWQ